MGNSLFAVFDGHGGAKVSEIAKDRFQDVLRSNLIKDEQEWLKTSFLKMDQELNKFSRTGATANVAYLDHDEQMLYVANAGDSRCFICQNRVLEQITKDHVPTDVIELQRIEKAGLTVFGGRVSSNISLSRSLGDFKFKETGIKPED